MSISTPKPDPSFTPLPSLDAANAFQLDTPSVPAMRAMRPGEVRIFAAGTRNPSGPFTGATTASGAMKRAQIKGAQRMVILVDPVTHESMPAILVRCDMNPN